MGARSGALIIALCHTIPSHLCLKSHQKIKMQKVMFFTRAETGATYAKSERSAVLEHCASHKVWYDGPGFWQYFFLCCTQTKRVTVKQYFEVHFFTTDTTSCHMDACLF